MIFLAGFFDVLFRGLVFVGIALAVGGIVFRTVVLNPSPTVAGAGLRRNSRLIALGAFTIFLSQVLSLGMTLSSLTDENGRWLFTTFLSTSSGLAGLLRAGLALLLTFSALSAERRESSRSIRLVLIALGALVVASSAWLVHGASRMEDRGLFMAITVFHQLAAAAWIGGVAHLIAQWRLLRGSAERKLVWPKLAGRFSQLALMSVAGLVLAGAFLSFRYVGSFNGLVGTAYGSMLLAKIVLTMTALALGGMNFLSLRGAESPDPDSAVFQRLPIFTEIETAIGMTILLAAAALTGQPPPIDTVAQQASPSEVAFVFAPKPLQLVPAPLAKLNAAGKPAFDPFIKATELDRIQSNFNHNVSGIFAVLIGLAALLHASTRSRLAGHWPLLFLPFWLFLVLFAQPTGWPLGNKGFWDSLLSAEVLQHRMGTLLVAALGIVEWRARRGKPRSERWRKAFPLLCFTGGALMLSHSHSLLADKSTYLIEVSHNTIGILAVLIGALSWLELRTTGRVARIAALFWPICFIGVGLVLLTYQESVIRNLSR